MGFFRTILRRSFFAAAAVSSLLLLATLILWPVSYYRALYADHFTAGGDEYYLNVDSGRAGVAYDWALPPARGWHSATFPPQWSHWSYRSWNTPDPDLGLGFAGSTFLGVCWSHLDPDPGPTYHAGLFPFSYLALLFSILPCWPSARSAGGAGRIGLCPKCGYDLRAQHAGSGGAVCPECGTPVAGRIQHK